MLLTTPTLHQSSQTLLLPAVVVLALACATMQSSNLKVVPYTYYGYGL